MRIEKNNIDKLLFKENDQITRWCLIKDGSVSVQERRRFQEYM